MREISVRLEVAPDGWGGAKAEEVRYVLENVAKHFLVGFQTPVVAHISIQCNPDPQASPDVRCLSVRGNRHAVILTTCDYCRWSFQFAHELCHILCHYHEATSLENCWFHESVCELASVFTIRQMARSWRHVHLSNWAWFSVAIQDYAKQLIERQDIQLPIGTHFVDWFRANERSLRSDRYQRGKNGIIALRILPIVEKNPSDWNAIQFLPHCGGPFETFLKKWLDRCPNSQRRFAREVAITFGFS